MQIQEGKLWLDRPEFPFELEILLSFYTGGRINKRGKCNESNRSNRFIKRQLKFLRGRKSSEDGIKKAIPTAEVMIRPVADGGEGTVTALTLDCRAVWKR